MADVYSDQDETIKELTIHLIEELKWYTGDTSDYQITDEENDVWRVRIERVTE